MSRISPSRLRELISYDPETGEFRWKKRSSIMMNKSRLGKKISPKATKHIRIRVDGRKYAAGQLAWLWMTGRWPLEFVDHEDRDPTNNKWSNLRLASRAENKRNEFCRTDNLIGLKGVGFDARSGKFRARITTAEGRRISLGVFPTADDASRAYALAAAQHHGEFARI